MQLWEVQSKLYDTLFLLKPHAELVTRVAHRLKANSLVLDAGCGSGRLGMDTPAHVVGVDFSSGMLRTAAEREDSVVRCSLPGGLSFADDSFDQATCINVLYALGDDYRSALDELYRVLRPGGELLIANPVSEALMPLVREHFRTASRGEVARTLLNLPRFMAWGANLTVRGFYESSDFKFLSEEELVAALKQAGFTIHAVEDCYAGIDRLVTARKD